MTDKIITTFETNITWICPTDMLPEKDEPVLVAIHTLVPTQTSVKQYYFVHTLSFNGRWFYEPTGQIKYPCIKYWAYLPEFE